MEHSGARATRPVMRANDGAGAAPAIRMPIKGNQRLCLFGRTGSGKSTLARQLLTMVPGRVSILDPKREFLLDDTPITDHFERKRQRQIIRVPVDDEEAGAWEQAIQEIYEYGNGVLYVDEATQITGPRNLPPALGRAIRLGRSRGLGVWIASQRPKDIPSAVFTEAEHFAIFQLIWQADRDKVRSFCGDVAGQALESISGHDFVYFDVLRNRTFHVNYTRGR